MTDVLVPVNRLVRWLDNFHARHGAMVLTAEDGALVVRSEDGAVARLRLPFSRSYDGPGEVSAFADAAVAPRRWGVLLTRKGGFAVAVLEGDGVVASKVGQRHVQGRTKAGGQSQQRFARRRANQARQAYEAAADHAARVLTDLDVLVCGGDRRAVEEVLRDPRLKQVAARRVEPWLPVPDPRRGVLEKAVLDATSVRVAVS